MNRFTQIDLNALYNHKAIAKKDEILIYNDNEKYGMGRFKHFFKDLPCSMTEKEIQVSGIPFISPVYPFGNIFDNFRCEEQTLTFQEIDCVRVHILGFSDDVIGDLKDQMTLIFKDQSIEHSDLALFAFYNAGAKEIEKQFKFDRDVLWGEKKAVLHCINNLDQQSLGLTYYSSIIKTQKKLTAIRFPDNFFMHVVSITLEI